MKQEELKSCESLFSFNLFILVFFVCLKHDYVLVILGSFQFLLFLLLVFINGISVV